MVIKIIASLFMASFFIVQIKNIYEDILKCEEEKGKISEIVIDSIILLLIVITMLTIWF